MQSARFWTEWGTPVLYMRADDGVIVPDPPPPAWRGRRLLLAGALLAVAALAVFGLRSVLVDRAPEAKPQPEPLAPLPLLVASDPRCPSSGGLSFAYLEPGTLQMAEGRSKWQVRISNAFCMGRYEVTEGQWNDIMGDGSEKQAETSDRLPSDGKSPADADEWVRRFNARHPTASCRLPSDAEWQYAARAGSTTRYSFGDDDRELRRFANCKGTADGYDDQPAPVGVFEPSRWGLFDMQGNLSEWVADGISHSLVSGTLVDPEGPVSGRRIRRGGSYKSACAVSASTTGQPARNRTEAGFRIACEPLRTSP